MNEANQSLVLRWARWQTRTLARVWPEESRKWGEAIASEAEEIEQPLQAMGWALGGVTVYSRALGAHLLEWLKMPVGERSGAMAPLAGAPGPKRSRLFAAVVLACAAGLLCLPEGREAIRTLRVVWEGFAQRDTDQPELQKIAKLAEKENDARMMAFAALSLEDGNKQELTERAVALDPQLVWIYAAAGHQHVHEAVKAEWLAKAEAADPDNAVPYLLAADTVVKPWTAKEGERSPTEQEFKRSLTSNAQWLALMDKAFQAPHYDSYYQRHAELNREIWRREPELPFTAAFQGLWMHWIPNLYDLRIFATFLVQQSERERIAGNLKKAEELLQEVDVFGSRMRQGRSADIEQLVGASLQREAARGWKALYEATGRAAEAQASAQRLAVIDQAAREEVAVRQRAWAQRERGAVDGWLVQISAIVMVLAVFLAIVSIGLLELRPAIWRREMILRRVLGWVTDFAPVAALAACAVFLLSFLPYARAFAAFRAGNPGAPNERDVMAKFWTLEGVTWKIGGADAAVLGWTVLTVVLSLAGLLLLARMLYRAMHTTETHA